MKSSWCHTFAFGLFLSATVFVDAAPFKPTSDATVLEQLPFRPGDPLARELAQLRAAWQRQPQDVDTAVRLARRYYEQVQGEGDPRYLGYAQAALAPWWNLSTPPVEVQLMRAGLRQFLHDFKGAIADLDQILQRQPRHAQALALRATIHIVQARYPQAKQDCVTLANLLPLIGGGCEAMVDGLTGNAQTAYTRLQTSLASQDDVSVDDRLWLLIRLAELAQRLGLPDRAEIHFKEALSLGIADTFLDAAFADFLLDRGRATEVIPLLKDKTRSDTLLLRLVLAERKAKAPEAARHEAELAARFNAAALRGDTVHQQEEARFALDVEQDAAKALRLANENWQLQREPRDARIFLEAALASKGRNAAKPVLDWLDSSGIEDERLRALSRELKGSKQ